MLGLGFWEIGFIFLVLILLFGAKSLPDIAKGLAKAFYAFKKELSDHHKEDNTHDQKNNHNI